MQGWEYKVLRQRGLNLSLRDGEGVEYGKFGEEMLNALGREGWQLCSTEVQNGIVIFMRPLE